MKKDKIIQIAIDTWENQRVLFGLGKSGNLYIKSVDEEGNRYWMLYINNE